MSNLTAHLVHRPHMPHPDLHRITEAMQHATEKAQAIFEYEERHECKRYPFIEDALMSREMGRL